MSIIFRLVVKKDEFSISCFIFTWAANVFLAVVVVTINSTLVGITYGLIPRVMLVSNSGNGMLVISDLTLSGLVLS